MCCRYLFSDREAEYVREITGQQEFPAQFSVRPGEIKPSEEALVLVRGESVRRDSVGTRSGPAGNSEIPEENASDNESASDNKAGGIRAQLMKWGFISGFDRRLLINARAETALSKKTFADSTLHRRCAVAAGRFWEWDREKNKVEFRFPERPVFLMAGIYRKFEDGNRFTVLTTQANDSVRRFHDRMPLILGEEQLETWLYDDHEMVNILRQPSPATEYYREYEQLSLFM